MTNEADRAAFLDLFPERERSGAVKRLLDPIRAGVAATPAAVVAAAVADVRNKLTQAAYWVNRGGSDEAVAIHSRVLVALTDSPEKAEAAAAYYLDYEALPDAEKGRVKRQHTADAVKTVYGNQPATEAQKKYLREGFHYRGDVDALTKQQASELIERFKAER